MTDPSRSHLLLVVDRSGSMTTIASDMEGGIKEILAEQAKLPGTILVDVVTFDDKVEFPFTDTRPDEIKAQIIVPRGMTALNDALGRSIVALGEKLAAIPEDERPENVIVAVVTDGQENSSKEFSAEQVKALVEKQKTEFDWSFTFLGTGIDSFAVAGGYGIGRGETMNFAPSSAGVSNAADAMSGYIGGTRTGLRGLAYSDEDRADAMDEDTA